MPKPWRLHIVFAPPDRIFAQALRGHLKTLVQQQLIDVTDSEIVPLGQALGEVLAARVWEAAVVIMLVSVHLLDTSFWETDLQPLLKRGQKEQVHVVPVLLRPVHLVGSPLDGIAVWPPNGLPVEAWVSQDAAWSELVGILQTRLPPPQASGFDASGAGTELSLADYDVGTEAFKAQPGAASNRLSPFPIRNLDAGQRHQLWRTLSLLISDAAFVHKLALKLNQGPLPANEPTDVLWQELLRRMHNENHDIAPLLNIAHRLAPGEPLWTQLARSGVRNEG
ncbi:MAG: hypothetical protein JNJ46_18570 [Myxococcales bacterium]|nr:hypothetical protein [Myxococcales bacterium]